MKKKVWIAVIILAAAAMAIAFLAAIMGKKPFKDLEADEILSAKVTLSPPDKTLAIDNVDELVGYLRDVIIYEEDDSYNEYVGQGAAFTLDFADGTNIEIAAFTPFIIIDGTGYRAKNGQAYVLTEYANELLNSDDANIILEEPPYFGIVVDDTCYSAVRGSYSWQTLNPDGTVIGTEADSAHPLDCKEQLSPPYEVSERDAELEFGEAPDEILNIKCWSDENWGNTEAEPENVEHKGNEITLKPGGNIYEITAKWNADNGYGGTASYYIYIEYIE